MLVQNVTHDGGSVRCVTDQREVESNGNRIEAIVPISIIDSLEITVVALTE